MRSLPVYDRIPIWENCARSELVEKSLAAVRAYREGAHYDFMGQLSSLEPEATEAREILNRSIERLTRVVQAAGVSVVYTHTMPATMGGRQTNLEILVNMFNLHNYQVPLTVVEDVLNRPGYSGDSVM